MVCFLEGRVWGVRVVRVDNVVVISRVELIIVKILVMYVIIVIDNICNKY